jgi:hypothetical protein
MSPLGRALAVAAALVVGMTALGVVLGVLAPALAGHTRPHPALSGRFGNAAEIVGTNLRVLAAPFLLWLLKFPQSRLGRQAGDILVLAVVAINTLTVGIELGHWRGQLIPYLPQLPIEWAALSVAVAAWLRARDNHANRRQLAVLATVTAVLLVAAAGLETWCTPHRHEPPKASLAQLDTVRDPHALVGDGSCYRHGLCAGTGPIASRSPAPFPSQRSVPLGRLASADRAHNNHRPPQGGITT